MRRQDDKSTRKPQLEAVDASLAKLNAHGADPTREAPGHHVPTWAREDAQAVAGALGLYLAGRKAHQRFGALLLRARSWPDTVTAGEQRAIADVAAAVLVREFRAATEAGRIPARIKWQVIVPGMTRILVDELLRPQPCWKCQGNGKLASVGAIAQRPCLICSGTGEAMPGAKTRARRMSIAVHPWRTYLQAPFERAAGELRGHLEAASRGVLEALG